MINHKSSQHESGGRTRRIAHQTDLSVSAPAKLNLHLSIVGRREDGYHLLETLMVKLDLADRLTVGLRKSGLRLEVHPPVLPVDEGNLVYRAALAFFETTGLDMGADLILEKRIPIAAGLGGGSSDAAAALIGLNELCGLPLGPSDLFAIGSSLGADVPFFLQPEPVCWATGIGEEIRPIADFEKLWVLLINPGWSLSTGWVYKNFKLKLTTKRRNHIFSRLYESSFTIDRAFHNDLEAAVIPMYPELNLIKDRLLETGAEGVLMTGSGPTIFGVFPDRSRRDMACGHLEKIVSEEWILIPTFTLTKAEVF